MLFLCYVITIFHHDISKAENWIIGKNLHKVKQKRFIVMGMVYCFLNVF